MLCDRSEYVDMPDNETLIGLIRTRLDELMAG